jgi:hypothetical protein
MRRTRIARIKVIASMRICAIVWDVASDDDVERGNDETLPGLHYNPVGIDLGTIKSQLFRLREKFGCLSSYEMNRLREKASLVNNSQHFNRISSAIRI